MRALEPPPARPGRIAGRVGKTDVSPSGRLGVPHDNPPRPQEKAGVAGAQSLNELSLRVVLRTQETNRERARGPRPAPAPAGGGARREMFRVVGRL